MKVIPTSLPEVIVVEPRVYRDDRGLFREVHRHDRFSEFGLPYCFRQDNHSRSRFGVLRGLHYQLNRPQGKLVTVIRGAIFDVAVDIRVGSPTFGEWVGVTLDEDVPRAVWVPPGFAHGFCAVSEVADVLYKCTDFYVPEDERGVIWSDPTIGVQWPVRSPVLSQKDQRYDALDVRRSDLPRYQQQNA